MEKGLVIKADNDKMTVRFSTTEACQKCGACLIKDNQAILPNIDNSVGAKVGDRVVIENKPRNSVTAALIIYLVPVIFLIAGYFLSLLIVNFLQIADKFAVLGAIIAFAFSFFLISLIDKHLSKSSKFKPVAVKKL